MGYLMPWKSLLRGNQLNPCTLTRELKENDERPSFCRLEELVWALGSFGLQIDSIGVAKEAIQELVLTIWRLQVVQEEGADDRDWQNHLVAWLVRRTQLRQCEVGANSVIHRSGIRISARLPGSSH